MITQYLESLVELTKSGKMSAFYEDSLANLKVVKIVPLHEALTADEVDRVKRFIRPEKKMCYKNAMSLCAMFPEKVEYVEGYFTCCGLPLEHAFNKIGDKYVDITAEFLLGFDKDVEYGSVCECSYKEACKATVKNGYYGNVYRTKFFDTLKNDGRQR